MTDTAARRDAETAFRAALAAVAPGPLVARFLHRLDPPLDRSRLRVAALGKAAPDMLRGAIEALGTDLEGVLVTPRRTNDLPDHALAHLRGGHPIPDRGSVAAGSAVAALAETCARGGDTLLLLLSGGTSALVTHPVAGISLAEIQTTTELLLRAGAPIEDLNAVRSSLDQLKGGGLAHRAAPAPVLTLALSDVLGDRLDLIGSGPTAPPHATAAARIRALRRTDVWTQLPPAVRSRLDRTLAGDPHHNLPRPGVENHVLGNLDQALDAVELACRQAGYECLRRPSPVVGEARERGRDLALEALRHQPAVAPDRPLALIAGGETTVTVHGQGRGGRNQELALAAALVLDGKDGITLASLATDGVDGPTDAAGAIVDGRTLPRIRTVGLDPQRALAENDCHPLLDAVGELVRTGPTGTNVGDLQLALVRASPGPRSP